jgi:hypothetical protein
LVSAIRVTVEPLPKFEQNLMPTSVPLGASGIAPQFSQEPTTGSPQIILRTVDALVVVLDALYGVAPKKTTHAIVEFVVAVRQISGGLVQLTESFAGALRYLNAIVGNDSRERLRLSVRGPRNKDNRHATYRGNDNQLQRFHLLFLLCF